MDDYAGGRDVSIDITTALIGFDLVEDAFGELRSQVGQDAVWAVGTNVEYAPHQELGTSKMRAQPHLRPALNETKREIDRLAATHDTTPGLIKAAALEVERKVKIKAPVDTGTLRSSYRAERLR